MLVRPQGLRPHPCYATAQTIVNLIQIKFYSNRFYLNKIDKGLSNKPKRLINRMFSSILVVLFLIRFYRHCI